MSQTHDMPMADTVTLAASRGKINDAFASLRSCFSGSSAPVSPAPVEGQTYYNTSDKKTYRYNSSGSWVAVEGALSATAGVILPDGTVAFTGDQSMGSNKLTALASGTASTDAVNKGQVDAQRHMAVVRLGDVSASTDAFVFALGAAATIVDVTLATTAGLTSGASDRWTINVRNLTGSVDLRSSDYDTNSDGDLTADARNALALDQNKAITAGHLLELQIVRNGSIGALTDLVAFVEYTVAV